MRGVIRSTVSILTALPGVKLAELRAEKAPSRFKLFNWGVNKTTKGDFIVNETTLAALPSNHRTHGLDKVALDFEHNTFPGSPEFERTQEPRPIAAMGAVEVVANDGVYLNAIEWRKAGLEQRENYEDLSPVPGTNDKREVVLVHSVALCRNGSVFDLTIENATALSALLNIKPTPKENTSMNITLSFLAVALGLAAEATEQQVKDKLATLGAPSALTPLSVKIGEKTETLTPQQLAQRVVDLASQFTALTASVTEKERTALITRFAEEGRVPMKSGKAYTADELKGLTVETLNILLDNTPPTVPLNARHGRTKETGSSGGGVHLFILKAEEFGKAKNITDANEAQIAFAGTPEGGKLYSEYLTTLSPRN